MSARREIGMIMFLLDSGDWGELAEAVEELKQKGALLFDAEAAWSAKFEEVEQKRKTVFLKRFATLKVGICQTHWQKTYKETGTTDIFPADMFLLEQLKMVSSPEFNVCSSITTFKVMCDKCVTELPSHYKAEVKGVPTPEQFWRWASDQQKGKLERHFKMPSLRDFNKVCEEAEKKRG